MIPVSKADFFGSQISGLTGDDGPVLAQLIDPLALEVGREPGDLVAAVAYSYGLRLAKQGLLPTPTLLSMGRKGRFHRLEQARWVKARVDELWTIDEIHEALERGDFKPTPGDRQDE